MHYHFHILGVLYTDVVGDVRGRWDYHRYRQTCKKTYQKILRILLAEEMSKAQYARVQLYFPIVRFICKTDAYIQVTSLFTEFGKQLGSSCRKCQGIIPILCWQQHYICPSQYLLQILRHLTLGHPLLKCQHRLFVIIAIVVSL